MEISQKIVDYAIWYYLKYFPSKKWLEKKLFAKFWPESEKWKIYGWITQEEVDFIINKKMESLIFEEQVAKSKIKIMIEKNKNFSYIRNKMFEKFFDKDLVLSILREEYDFENETLLSEEKLRKQVFSLYSKWKSKNYIKNKFLERRQDREVVEKILDEIFFDWEMENLQKEYKKIKNLEKEKIIRRLLSKGFNYNDIKNIF